MLSIRVLPFLLLLPCGLSATEWPQPTRENRPWTRWWWHGSAVDRDNIRAELDKLQATGIGGVEITPIYGVKGAESRFIPYLSKPWVEIVAFTAAEAEKRGMGVDLTPGSGWRIGAPFVTSDYAAVSARIEQTPGGFALKQIPTGDRVKRPAPGGDGFTIDVYSAASLSRFLREFDSRIDALPPGSVRSWFHDSFEYTANWSPMLEDEYRKRRGYAVTERLAELGGHGDPDTVARVLSDYRETISDMLLANFVQPLGEWAKRRGGSNRNQAHGSPGNLLDLYAASDIPETEIFGGLGNPDNDPLINKFASSAAHVAARPLVSAESYTWLAEHFHETLEEIKRATDQLLLAGVNHIFFHGTAYSPSDAAWPGWVFYASSQIHPRNPIWRDLPALTSYITRAQSVLQSGEPANEILLYWPYFDVIASPGPMFQQLPVHGPNWFYQQPVGAIARNLWARGYSFDFISDRQLANAGVRQTILVPATRRMPVETLRRLLALAEGGARIVFADHLPDDVPGLGNLAERRREFRALADSVGFQPARGGVLESVRGRGRILLSASVERALAATGAVRETFVGSGGSRDDALLDAQLQFIRRRNGTSYSYFIVNMGAAAFDGSLPLSVKHAGAILMDPMTGAIGAAAMDRGRIRLQLAAGASIIVQTTAGEPGITPWRYRNPAGPPLALDGAWQVSFAEGGPRLPASFTTAKLGSWTNRGGDAGAFAGTARYTIRFDRPAEGSFLLDLGDVRESARVTLNGRLLGTLLMKPYQIETGTLRASGNVMEVEVTNVAANRIRDMDQRKIPWRIFHDINVVNRSYQPLDASEWAVRASGLLGAVSLTPLR